MHEPSAPVLAPYLQDSDFTLYNCDARKALAGLPDESVHMCVTSPPFFGLRDYGTGTWEGGDVGCDHRIEKTAQKKRRDEGRANVGAFNGSMQVSELAAPQYRETCDKCGAVRTDHQIGLEETPEGWVASLVEVFEEAKRVLRKDGTLWVECGDSYASGTGRSYDRTYTDGGNVTGIEHGKPRFDIQQIGCKPKDLIGQPFLLAFALREAGWYWRNVCIWHKPNPMPESVRDRFTVSHSYVLLFSKSPRYFFDSEAVRESFGENTHSRGKGIGVKQEQEAEGGTLHAGRNNASFGRATMRNLSERPPQTETLDGLWECIRCGVVKTKSPQSAAEGCGACGGSLVLLTGEAPRGPDGRRQTAVKQGDNSIQHRDGERWPNSGRNARSVWTIATQPLPYQHYAAFPEALAERCIKAGTSERGCCPDCGAPWKREIEHQSSSAGRTGSNSPVRQAGRQGGFYDAETTTLGWRPSCHCGHEYGPDGEYGGGGPRTPIPCTVFDPFLGSGTTALVARRLGRHCIGSELSETYCELIARRTQQLSLMAE